MELVVDVGVAAENGLKQAVILQLQYDGAKQGCNVRVADQ